MISLEEAKELYNKAINEEIERVKKEDEEFIKMKLPAIMQKIEEMVRLAVQRREKYIVIRNVEEELDGISDGRILGILITELGKYEYSAGRLVYADGSIGIDIDGWAR